MGGCVSEQSTLSASTTRSTQADQAFMAGVSPGWLVPLASGVSKDLVFVYPILAYYSNIRRSCITAAKGILGIVV